VDPAALVLAFQSGGVDLPVDFGHQNDNPDARLKGPVPAAGWIKELRADAGLWGRVASTATAAEMIGNRAYRYPARLLHGAGRVPYPQPEEPLLNELARPMPRPTAPVQAYVDGVGAEMAVKFLPAFGGAEMHVANNPCGRSGHQRLIGDDAALRLGQPSRTACNAGCRWQDDGCARCRPGRAAPPPKSPARCESPT